MFGRNTALCTLNTRLLAYKASVFPANHRVVFPNVNIMTVVDPSDEWAKGSPPRQRRHAHQLLGVQIAGFRVQGSGFRVQDSGFRDQGSRFEVKGSGFRD